MIDSVFEGSMNPCRWFNHFKSTIVRKNNLNDTAIVTSFQYILWLLKFLQIWFDRKKNFSHVQNTWFSNSVMRERFDQQRRDFSFSFATLFIWSWKYFP